MQITPCNSKQFQTHVLFLKPITVVLTTTVKLNAKIFPNWSALGKVLPAGKSRWFFLSTQLRWGHIWSGGCSPWPTNITDTNILEQASKGQWRWWRDGCILHSGELRPFILEKRRLGRILGSKGKVTRLLSGVFPVAGPAAIRKNRGRKFCVRSGNKLLQWV